MSGLRSQLLRWLPALLWMAAIFYTSATPAPRLPNFGLADFAVKKGGHFMAYAILALAYQRGLGGNRKRSPTAWLLALLYALLDEFHQSFVPGRHPSLVDALVFDGGGALAALLVSHRLPSGHPKQTGVRGEG